MRDAPKKSAVHLGQNKKKSAIPFAAAALEDDDDLFECGSDELVEPPTDR